MVETPRRSSRSKSPSTPLAAAEEATTTTTTNAQAKSAEQLAEEREKRRERLLAGRDARLSKIVSSVGGTTFTPPPYADLPAEVPKPQGAAKTNINEQDGVRFRHVAPAAPTIPSMPSTQSPAAPIAPHADGFLASERIQTILMLAVNVGAILAGWRYLGRDCFKQVFTTVSPLTADCQLLFPTARKAFLGLFTATMVPIVLAQWRSGGPFTIPMLLNSMLCMWVAVLMAVGILAERLL